MLSKISIKNTYINNRLSKAFAKNICVIFILFKIRFKEDGVKVDLKKIYYNNIKTRSLLQNNKFF